MYVHARTQMNTIYYEEMRDGLLHGEEVDYSTERKAFLCNSLYNAIHLMHVINVCDPLTYFARLGNEY